MRCSGILAKDLNSQKICLPRATLQLSEIHPFRLFPVDQGPTARDQK